MSKRILCLALKTASFLFLSAVLALSAVSTVRAATGKNSSVKKHTVLKRSILEKTVVKKHSTAKKNVTKKLASFRNNTRLLHPSKPVKAAITVIPAPLSYGYISGLHSERDPLNLKSGVALVIDQDTREVLFKKNDHAVLPIASLTKLMTGLVVSNANLPMNEIITVTEEDVDNEKHSRSRLKVGTALSRRELLHLALMSSENRAAHALGRTYPGGMAVFVELMNAKARLLGMTLTSYAEPTGLSRLNQSSANDLVKLVGAAHGNALLRELTTSLGHQVVIDGQTLQFNNTNQLVKNTAWKIGLQKTGYISEAGQCLVMQTKISGRKLIMVFLDSADKLSRIADAERVRHWVESTSAKAHFNAGKVLDQAHV